MIHGEWLAATIDINRSSAPEFTGDTAPKFSSLVDLGRAYEKLVIIVPATITAGELEIHVQRLASTAIVPCELAVVNTDTAFTVTLAASKCFTCDCITGIRYLRLYSVTDQGADATFYVMGVRS